MCVGYEGGGELVISLNRHPSLILMQGCLLRTLRCESCDSPEVRGRNGSEEQPNGNIVRFFLDYTPGSCLLFRRSSILNNRRRRQCLKKTNYRKHAFLLIMILNAHLFLGYTVKQGKFEASVTIFCHKGAGLHTVNAWIYIVILRNDELVSRNKIYLYIQQIWNNITIHLEKLLASWQFKFFTLFVFVGSAGRLEQNWVIILSELVWACDLFHIWSFIPTLFYFLTVSLLWPCALYSPLHYFKHKNGAELTADGEKKKKQWVSGSTIATHNFEWLLCLELIRHCSLTEKNRANVWVFLIFTERSLSLSGWLQNHLFWKVCHCVCLYMFRCIPHIQTISN